MRRIKFILNLKGRFLWLLPLLALFLTQCEKQENFKYIPSGDNEELEVNAWEFIQGEDSLSLMEEAIELAGIENEYTSEEDSKTFILPVNSAFREYLNANGYTGVSDIPVPILKYVLLYHIIDEKILSSDTGLVTTDPLPYETENGQVMYFSHNNNYQIIINQGTSRNWTIQISNLQATNGAMHISPAVVYYSADVPVIDDDNLERDTLESIQDGYVNNGGQKNTNYSNEDLIKVKNVGEDVEGGIYDRRGFLMFDLNGITKSGNLRNATVELGVSFTAAKGIPLYLFNVNDNNWLESSLTWANAPQEDPTPIAMLISKKVDFFRWDVTDYIEDKLQNPGKISLKIDAEAGSDETDEFYSHRNANNPHPRIVITFSSGNSNLAMGSNKGTAVKKGGISVLNADMLEMEGAAHGDIIYTIESLPEEGWLINGSNVLKQGDSFTQLDIDAENIVYVHNGQGSDDDSFSLSVKDLDGGEIAPFDFQVTVE